MKLTDYIFGSRRGREANRLERDAMSDPFLAEALDGYESVYGNHSDKLADLRQRIEQLSEHGKRALPSVRRRRIAVWCSAAAVTLGAVVWLFVVPALRMQSQPQDAPVMVAANTAPRMQAAKAVVTESEVLAQNADGETTVAVAALADVAEVGQEGSADGAVVAVADGVAGNNGLVYNPEFVEYFKQNRKVTMLPDGSPVEGSVIVEFRVNDAGVPSAIQIVSGFSAEVNSDLIRLLIEGPRWEPTGNSRIRIEVTYP